MAGYGGQFPLVKYGVTLTVEAPDGTTTAAPVEQGDVFKLGGTASDGTGYKVVACSDGNDATSSVLVMALHRITSVNDLGVLILSGKWAGVDRVRYHTGAAPTLGQSIEASGVNVREIKGKSFDGDGYVLKVDTSALEVEVLV